MLTVEYIAVVRLSQTSYELNQVTFGNSKDLRAGQQIAVISSPFGCISPVSFFNSMSAGVISHTFESENSDLVLTDARCLPGSEGGGVFDSSGKLVGVVAPRLTFLKSELTFRSPSHPMDMTFVIPSNQITDLLTNIKYTPQRGTSTADVFIPQQVAIAKKSVVCLQVGTMWASGFVVSKQDILTNAHLFKTVVHEINRATPIPSHEYDHLSVNVYFNRPNHPDQQTPSVAHRQSSFQVSLKARVIYLSHTHLDVALLQVEEKDREIMNQHLRPVKTSLAADSSIGMPVWVLAHGFSPEQGMESICAYGMIANVVLREGVPASLQTSASIHSGNSGGLLVNSEGELIGMVMSHATHKGTRTFTQLNFSIPYQQIITLVNFANGEDQHAIQRLQNQPTDKFLAALWKFEGEPKPTPKTGQNFMKFVEQMKTAPPNLPRSKL